MPGLSQKLKIKEGYRVALFQAPEGYVGELAPLPEGVVISQTLDPGPFDWVQIFVKTQKEMEALLSQVVAVLKPSSILWISFPKGSSKIQTDLTRDVGWDAIPNYPLRYINLVSVNDTWSAFSLRLNRPGEPPQRYR